MKIIFKKEIESEPQEALEQGFLIPEEEVEVEDSETDLFIEDIFSYKVQESSDGQKETFLEVDDKKLKQFLEDDAVLEVFLDPERFNITTQILDVLFFSKLPTVREFYSFTWENLQTAQKTEDGLYLIDTDDEDDIDPMILINFLWPPRISRRKDN